MLETWEEKLTQGVKNCQAEHFRKRFPKRSDPDQNFKKLGKWVVHQRQQLKEGNLTDAQVVAALEDVLRELGQDVAYGSAVAKAMEHLAG